MGAAGVKNWDVVNLLLRRGANATLLDNVCYNFGRERFITKLTQQLNNSLNGMHYTTQLHLVLLILSLKLSLMLVQIRKLIMMMEKLQLMLHVNMNI
jgi:hypothetical protein